MSSSSLAYKLQITAEAVGFFPPTQSVYHRQIAADFNTCLARPNTTSDLQKSATRSWKAIPAPKGLHQALLKQVHSRSFHSGTPSLTTNKPPRADASQANYGTRRGGCSAKKSASASARHWPTFRYPSVVLAAEFQIVSKQTATVCGFP